MEQFLVDPSTTINNVENDALLVATSEMSSLDKEEIVVKVKEILKLCPAERLMSLYKISSFSSTDEFLQKVATIRSKLKKGGIVDPEAATKIVLHDWNEGKIPYYTLPPNRDQGGISDSAIVSELGKEFNVDEVYSNESSYIGSLASTEDFFHVEVPPGAPLQFDEQMADKDVENHKADQIGEEPMADNVEEHLDTNINTTKEQNDKLYAAEGILDPRKRRAEKKRRKAQKAAVRMIWMLIMISR